MRLGKIFDVEVGLHWSVLIIMFLIGSNVYDFLSLKIPGVAAVLGALIVAVGVPVSILAHEFGHILMGRKYNVGCRGVTLHMFGGVAQLSGHPPTAQSEFFIALAGPAVSAALALLMLVLSVICLLVAPEQGVLSYSTMVLSSLNLVFAIFNLVPAFPMDGGRVLRSAVWWKTRDFIKSTKVAVVAGRVVGSMAIGAGLLMCFGIYIPFLGSGVFSGVWLAAIAALVMWMGTQELKHARMRRMY